jgi:hypothetical protein
VEDDYHFENFKEYKNKKEQSSLEFYLGDVKLEKHKILNDFVVIFEGIFIPEINFLKYKKFLIKKKLNFNS